MKEKFAEQMERELQGRVVLSERQMEQFYRYYEMLTEWNKVMNLTAITEMEEVVTKHFVLEGGGSRSGGTWLEGDGRGNGGWISGHSPKNRLSGAENYPFGFTQQED